MIDYICIYIYTRSHRLNATSFDFSPIFQVSNNLLSFFQNVTILDVEVKIYFNTLSTLIKKQKCIYIILR